MGESAIGVEFMLTNPFARHNIGARRTRKKAPGAVVDEHLVLVSHGSPPVRVGEPTAVVRQDRRD
jgi:hypothetical protein